MEPFRQRVCEHIRQVTDLPFNGELASAGGGGCINECYRLFDAALGRGYFVKRNRAEMYPMFETEADGLIAIADTRTITVPRPLCHGLAGAEAYLVLGWLDLTRSASGDWSEMGRALARLHAHEQDASYGWERDNFIGTTPQINTRTEDWSDFFARKRLGYQVELARSKGCRLGRFEELKAALPEILGHRTRPSLVHGDLWSGNTAFTASGEPVIYDAAVYCGDPEVDLAMTELFGGFPKAFYRGYEETLPLEPGHEGRRTAYNLYHVLNHFNLFGGGYGAQAEHMIDALLDG